MASPLIGITTSLNDNEQRLDHDYVVAVEKAGGIPIILPILSSLQATTQLAALLDGLIITGGPAIEDGLIGSLPDDIKPTDPRRVKTDKWILSAFTNTRRPVFGICYGMQLISAVNGGTIYADVEEQQPGIQTHSKGRGASTHDVQIEPDTRFARIIGSTSLNTNTRHIQALAQVGDGLIVNARAHDGVVEGLENADGTLFGVQFHPEQMGELGEPLFRDFVERARQASERPV